MLRIFRVLSYLIKLCVAYVCGAFVKLFKPSMRNVWIVSERGTDARDNGYFFYKYLVEKHPEIKVYYVIKSSSADAGKIAPEHRIESDSFKHFLVFAICRVRISSHAWGGDIPKADYYAKFGFYKKSRKKFVFLQHGICKDFLPGLCYPRIMPSLFVCGADPEFEYIKSAFHHPDGVVQYTGLARYDSLCEFQTKNQILIMPTFRKYLQGLDADAFEKEEYYKKWQELLEAPEIISLLEKNGLELIFYPHYEMQKYVGMFGSGSERVKIADFGHYDVQTLLKESKLLITDFSSVFFDFAYMRKPVLFYQFDRDRYISGHYDFTKGYFDYDTTAPGKVVFEKSAVIDYLSAAVSGGFEMEKEYSDRRDAFFTKSDKHNCDRIFEAIEQLKR